MRTIKFRAWEKYDKDYAEEIGEPGKMHFGDAWGENQEVQEKRTIVIAGIYHDSSWDWDDFTVMQFTGLQDKNGKEIYEGDIFQDEEDSVYNAVEWDEFHCGWTTSQWFIGKDMHELERMEIIGNIYENPNLLK